MAKKAIKNETAKVMGESSPPFDKIEYSIKISIPIILISAALVCTPIHYILYYISE